MLSVATCQKLFSLFFLASNFAHSLTEVENTQGQLNGSLAAHSQLLKEVKEGLITNMNTIKKTVEQLESRLAALK